MCGIAGIFSSVRRLDISDTVDSMVASISHRGPDRQNVWSNPDGPLQFDCATSS